MPFRFIIVLVTVLSCLMSIVSTRVWSQSSLELRQAIVRIEKNVVCNNETIRLGDIASVFSTDVNLKKTLENVDLDQWTGQLKQIRITQQQISIRLKLANLPGKIEMIGPDETLVTRELATQKSRNPAVVGQAVRSQLSNRIIDAIADLITRQYGVQEDDVLIEVLSSIRIPASLNPDNISVQVLTESDRILGRRMLRISISSGGRTAYQRSVLVNTTASKTVLVASQSLSKGDLLSVSNTRPEKKHFQNSQLNSYVDSSQIGKPVNRNIQAGAKIRKSEIAANQRSQQPVLIKRNDKVTVVAVKGTVRVTLAGAVSLDSGKKDEIIRVRNPKTKKTITARVVSASEVRAIF